LLFIVILYDIVLVEIYDDMCITLMLIEIVVEFDVYDIYMVV